MKDTPRAFSAFMISKSLFTSRMVREEVGSSRTISFAS